MIDHNLILTAIKTILDNDYTLSDYLKREEDSKVFIGGPLPDLACTPYINIMAFTDEQIDTPHNLSDFIFLINAYSDRLLNSQADMAELENILQRAEELIDDTSITVADHKTFPITVDGRNPVTANPFGGNNTLGGIRCQMFAAK